MASVVIFLVRGRRFLGTSPMFAIAGDINSFGHELQEADKLGQGHRAETNPVFSRNRDHHAFVGGLQFVREQVAREFSRDFLAMRCTQGALQYRESIFQHQRDTKREECRLGITEGIHFTLQGHRQFMKHRFDQPSLLIEFADLHRGGFAMRQVAQDIQFRVTVAGGIRNLIVIRRTVRSDPS